ncbi:hypothetical protein [Aeromonas enteropelogenes]|uniref:hypothetical protein n=1 Tax=Aeromonas enteropelogenes TaxID=29489 RepID=UPI000F52DB28|nr:hypothetical protein [Aeromonas enteropelogenes]RQM69833.1 hypothetical protein EHZ64_02115 [Aeromonas enteropelogenes]
MKFSIKIVAILFVSLIPVGLFLFATPLELSWGYKKDLFIEMSKLLSPLMFSIVILIINTMIEDSKIKSSERKETIAKYNKVINQYNECVLLQSRVYENKYLEYSCVREVIYHFANLYYPDKILSLWKSLSIEYGDVSNSADFRQALRNLCVEIISTSRDEGTHKDFIEYISSTKLYPFEVRVIDSEMELFFNTSLHKLINERHRKDIVSVAGKFISNGGDSFRYLKKFNCSVSELKKIPTSDSLYGVICDLFFLYEVLIFELYIFENALKITQSEFLPYIRELSVQYKNLDELIELLPFNTPRDLEDDFRLKIIPARLSAMGIPINE